MVQAKDSKREPLMRFSAKRFLGIWERRKAEGRLDVVGWSKACGVKSPSTLYTWRRGEQVPGTDELFLLARALDVDFRELLEPVTD